MAFPAALTQAHTSPPVVSRIGAPAEPAFIPPRHGKINMVAPAPSRILHQRRAGINSAELNACRKAA